MQIKQKNYDSSYHKNYSKKIAQFFNIGTLQLIVNICFMKTVSVKTMITLSYFLYNSYHKNSICKVLISSR